MTDAPIPLAFPLTSDPARFAAWLGGVAIHVAVQPDVRPLPDRCAVEVCVGETYVVYRIGEGLGAFAGTCVLVAKDRLARLISEVAPADLAIRDATAVRVESAAVLRDPARVLAYVEGADLVGHTCRDPHGDRPVPLVAAPDGLGEAPGLRLVARANDL